MPKKKEDAKKNGVVTVEETRTEEENGDYSIETREYIDGELTSVKGLTWMTSSLECSNG